MILSRETKLYGLIAVMVLLWSGNYIVAKVALREIPPVLLMCLRTAVSGVLIAPLYWRELRTKNFQMTTRDFWTLAALGVVGVMLNQFFFVLGVGRTTVAHSSMIVATSPVWVLLIAAVMGIERITAPKLGGMVMAIAGIGILQVFRPKLSAHGPSITGDIFILLCSLFFAMLTAAGKKLKPQGNAVAVNAFGYIGGSLVLAPVLYYASRGFDFSRVSVGAWLGVLYMAAFSSVLCYLIYYWALAHMPASRIATFQYLQPFLATVMAVFLLGEDLTAPTVASGCIIFAGVFVTERFG